jgi:hypothetical protein
LKRRTGERVNYQPFQKVADDYPEIQRSEFEGAVQLIETNGNVTSGADAIFMAIGISEGRHLLLRSLVALSGFMFAARMVNRFVARHRQAASFLFRG